MSEYECTEHLLNEIERLREANFELREGELRQRIKQLEAVVNDPEALWTNWLRGDVKLPAGIGDVRQYQERIKRLEEAIQERDKEWFQVIESILGFHPVSMTEALHIGIERIKKQKQRIKRLEDACDEAIAFCEFHGPVGATPDTARLIAKNIRKAKEAKP